MEGIEIVGLFFETEESLCASKKEATILYSLAYPGRIVIRLYKSFAQSKKAAKRFQHPGFPD
jgi:hypothetical protein